MLYCYSNNGNGLALGHSNTICSRIYIFCIVAYISVILYLYYSAVHKIMYLKILSIVESNFPLSLTIFLRKFITHEKKISSSNLMLKKSEKMENVGIWSAIKIKYLDTILFSYNSNI